MATTPIQVDVYDDNPDAYDAFQSFFMEQSEDARGMFEALFKAFAIGPDHRLLEVGMGTGLNVPFFPPTAELHGIDRSEGMLNVARRRLQQLSREAQVQVADAYALPYPDEHFDRVACIFVLCALDRPGQALAEMHRVCRPGGRVALFDYHRSQEPSTQLSQQFFNETMRRGVVHGGKSVLACDSLYDLDAHLGDLDYERVHDARMDSGLARSFRASLLARR